MKKYLKLIGIGAVSGVIALVNVKATLDDNHLSNSLNKTLLTFSQSIGESNNNGGNPFYYEHLSGRPETCTLYKYVGIKGDVHVGTGDSEFGAGYTKIQVKGIVETCPHRGGGCTVYSCRETN